MGGSRFNFSDAEKDAHRRVTLQYAAVAQGSTLAAMLTIAALCQLWQWYIRNATSKKDQVQGLNQSSWLDKVVWWLSDEVYLTAIEPCRPDEWILGTFWFSWLFLISSVGNTDEPFSFARLGQDLLDSKWTRLLSLPDADAFHLSSRFAIVAVSQWPLLPLLGMKRSNPLARLLGCSHTRLNRYRGVLSTVMFILLLLHTLVHLRRMDTETLYSESVQLRTLGYLSLYVMLIVAQTLRTRRPIWGLGAVVPMLVFVWLIWDHALPARVYLLQALAVLIVTLTLPTETRVALVKQPSPEAQAVTQAVTHAALSPAAEGQDWQPPIIILKIEQRDNTSAIDAKDDVADKKRVVVATMRTTPGWLVRCLAELWRNPTSWTFGNDAQNSVHRHENMILEFVTAPVTTSEEKTRVSVRFEGPRSTLGQEMENLIGFDADHTLFIAGGLTGYLAYPAYFAYVAAQRKKRGTCSARVVWTVNSRSGTSCAIPRCALDSDALQDAEDGDVVVLYPDGELINDSEERSSATAPQPDTAKQSCALTGTCPHASVGTIIDRVMRRNPCDSVAVVVLGPGELEREASRAMRPWIMRGRKLWWLFEDFPIY